MVSHQKNVEPKTDISRTLTIQELNKLTASLNIDWLTIINNMLITKIGSDELIQVKQPEKLAAIADFLSTIENE